MEASNTNSPTKTNLVLEQLFPQLRDPQLVAQLLHHGKRQSFPEGVALIEPGQKIEYVPLILDGSLRIMREDSEGRELLLYYLQEGETCAISLNCCYVSGMSEVRAITETQLEVLMIPLRFLDTWMDEYPCWKEFIFGTFRNRFEELLTALDSIAFQKMDERILQYLQERSIAQNSNVLEGTHQKIADELHSTREVISRLLKQLEKKGLVKLGRNRIELIQ